MHIGVPDCPFCKGRGFIYKASMLEGGSTCSCMEPFLRIQNLERTWPSLERTELSDSIKLLPAKYAEKNIWFTGSREVFRQYLKKFILNMPIDFTCKVRTDAELLDSWFGTAKAQGTKIYDLEIDKSTLQAIDIRDLVEPYDLTIIWLGVKELPNKESPSSLLEAINYRAHPGKQTWIVDQPDRPLDATHKFYSEELMRIMSDWSHLVLTEKSVIKKEIPSRSSFVPKQIEESASNKYIDKWTTLDKPKKKFRNHE